MKITIETKTHKSIPYNEYTLEGTKPKGLLFIQHGFTSNKTEGAEFLTLPFVRKGYKVVSIDAYKHGDRKEEPFFTKTYEEQLTNILEIMPRTSSDILTLYQDKFSKYETFDYIGISMGGMIGFHLVTITDKIRKISPVIGAPNFIDSFTEASVVEKNDILAEYVVKEREYILSIDPEYNVNKMKFGEMYIMNTKNDEVVPDKYSRAFYENNKQLNIRFKSFEGGHETTGEMIEELFHFIESEMAE